jgi:glycosyltransferase involved in cell wall biosynthesis
MKQIFKEVNPDIIHAHNIFSAKMAKEIGEYPIVYDNHEYWSVYLKRQLENTDTHKNESLDSKTKTHSITLERNFRAFLKSRYVTLWLREEKEIVATTPTITVSTTIAEDLNKIGNRVYLVPNYPLQEEISWIKEPIFHQKLSSVYAGVEPTGTVKSMHRNIEGFIDLFDKYEIGKLVILGWENQSTKNVEFLGFVSRKVMYQQMQNHSIGIIPFKAHWSHVFISPNKAYEYAHAGLFVVTSSSFVPIVKTLEDNCITFVDYSDLKNKMFDLLNDMDTIFKKRLGIYKFARNNLLWEKYENNIFEAYKQA